MDTWGGFLAVAFFLIWLVVTLSCIHYQVDRLRKAAHSASVIVDQSSKIAKATCDLIISQHRMLEVHGKLLVHIANHTHGISNETADAAFRIVAESLIRKNIKDLPEEES